MKFFKLSILIIFLLSLNISAADYYWYDGKKKRKVTIVPDLIAQVNDNDLGKELKDVDPNVKEINSKLLGYKIYKINSSVLKKSIKSGKGSQSFKNSSPVFKDPSGKLRILVGNIILVFEKDWTKDMVVSWAESKNLKIVKCISEYNNIYLVESPAGIESLELANSLKDEEGVKISMPNWSKSMELK